MQELPLDFESTAPNALPGELTTDHEANFASAIGRYLGVIMVVAFLILLLYLIWGAFEWLTSAGDSSKLTAARNRMMHAVIGILILSSVLALFTFVEYLLGINILTFTGVGT